MIGRHAGFFGEVLGADVDGRRVDLRVAADHDLGGAGEHIGHRRATAGGDATDRQIFGTRVEELLALGRDGHGVGNDAVAAAHSGERLAANRDRGVSAGNANEQPPAGGGGELADVIPGIASDAQRRSLERHIVAEPGADDRYIGGGDRRHPDRCAGADGQRMRLAPGALLCASIDDDLALGAGRELGAGDLSCHLRADEVFGLGASSGRRDQAETRRRGEHLVVEIDIAECLDTDTLGRPDRGPAKTNTACDRAAARAVDQRLDDRGHGVVGIGAATGKGHADSARDRDGDRRGPGLDRRPVGREHLDRALHRNRGAIDQRSHRAIDRVVGERDADRQGTAEGTESRRDGDSHHRRADHRLIGRKDGQAAVNVDPVLAQVLGGVAQGRERLGVDPVGCRSAGTADSHTDRTARRGRNRARKDRRLDQLPVGRPDVQVDDLRRGRLFAGLAGLGVTRCLDRLGSHQRGPCHHRLDLVGRTGQDHLPLRGIRQILRDEDVVGRAVLVSVLALDIVVANVFVDLACTRARARTHQHLVALRDPLGVVGTLEPGDLVLVDLVGVVTDKIAGDRHADRGPHTDPTTCAHADRGRDDGRVDEACRGGIDRDCRAGRQRAVLDPRERVGEQDIERRGARAADADTSAATQTDRR